MLSPFLDQLLLTGMQSKAALTLVGHEYEMQLIRILARNIIQNVPAGARAITNRGAVRVIRTTL
jgi:hypothetical protein